nr:MAG TPA: hypothetical protein [Caudoviricetes sp.]
MNKTLDWTHAIVSLIECHFVQLIVFDCRKSDPYRE